MVVQRRRPRQVCSVAIVVCFFSPVSRELVLLRRKRSASPSWLGTERDKTWHLQAAESVRGRTCPALSRLTFQSRSRSDSEE